MSSNVLAGWQQGAAKRGGIVERASKILPGKLKKRLGYPYKRYMFLRYVKNAFGARYTPHGRGPLPPSALIANEALLHEDDLQVVGKPEAYFGSGFLGAWTILTMLHACSFKFDSLRSVLEFGCGTGRVIRHFRNIGGLRLAGTDANPKPIEWDRKNLPNIDFYTNELAPPLAFENESFDLVYALSVFTHIPLELQRNWLDELHRILVPGGYLLCTVTDDAVTYQLSDEDRAQLKRDGALTFDRKHPRASYSTQLLGSWDVFQTRDQVRAVFGVGFDILAYTFEPAVSGQQTLVLRKASR
jgi:SAM-dependent methyltransferase